jgi:two-component system, chemotaxis family, sensor kinase CheA
MPFRVPPEIIARFRSVARERLDRVEAAWLERGDRPSDRELALQMRREVHTLKGEADMLGFRNVSLLCHELERLLTAADERLDGIDVPGFVRQVGEVLSDADRRTGTGSET